MQTLHFRPPECLLIGKTSKLASKRRHESSFTFLLCTEPASSIASDSCWGITVVAHPIQHPCRNGKAHKPKAGNVMWKRRITGKCLYELHKNVSQEVKEGAERGKHSEAAWSLFKNSTL